MALVYFFLIFLLCRPTLAQDGEGAPEAAAGLRVPGTAFPWALDIYNGKQELVPIHHATTKLNKHTGKNLAGGLAGSFFYRPEMTTELPGEHAKAQLHTKQPVLYFHVEGSEDPEGDDRGDKWAFQIVPAKILKDRREVTQISFNALTTRARRKDTAIAATVEKLPHGWMRVSMREPLAAGEYVLLAQPERADELSTVVYPFGVDEKAPESPEAVTANSTDSEKAQHSGSSTASSQ